MKKLLSAIILVLFIIACSPKEITGNAIKELEQDIEPIIEEEQDTCTDTDSGIVKTTQGTISGTQGGKAFKKTDECIAGLLIEYYCEGNMPVSENFRCKTDCKEGICV